MSGSTIPDAVCEQVETGIKDMTDNKSNYCVTDQYTFSNDGICTPKYPNGMPGCKGLAEWDLMRLTVSQTPTGYLLTESLDATFDQGCIAYASKIDGSNDSKCTTLDAIQTNYFKIKDVTCAANITICYAEISNTAMVDSDVIIDQSCSGMPGWDPSWSRTCTINWEAPVCMRCPGGVTNDGECPVELVECDGTGDDCMKTYYGKLDQKTPLTCWVDDLPGYTGDNAVKFIEDTYYITTEKCSNCFKLESDRLECVIDVPGQTCGDGHYVEHWAYQDGVDQDDCPPLPTGVPPKTPEFACNQPCGECWEIEKALEGCFSLPGDDNCGLGLVGYIPGKKVPKDPNDTSCQIPQPLPDEIISAGTCYYDDPCPDPDDPGPPPPPGPDDPKKDKVGLYVILGIGALLVILVLAYFLSMKTQ